MSLKDDICLFLPLNLWQSVQVRLGVDLMCRRMYCYLPKEPGFCASVVPQEYTSCDNKKVSVSTNSHGGNFVLVCLTCMQFHLAAPAKISGHRQLQYCVIVCVSF